MLKRRVTPLLVRRSAHPGNPSGSLSLSVALVLLGISASSLSSPRNILINCLLYELIHSLDLSASWDLLVVVPSVLFPFTLKVRVVVRALVSNLPPELLLLVELGGLGGHERLVVFELDVELLRFFLLLNNLGRETLLFELFKRLGDLVLLEGDVSRLLKRRGLVRGVRGVGVGLVLGLRNVRLRVGAVRGMRRCSSLVL